MHPLEINPVYIVESSKLASRWFLTSHLYTQTSEIKPTILIFRNSDPPSVATKSTNRYHLKSPDISDNNNYTIYSKGVYIICLLLIQLEKWSPWKKNPHNYILYIIGTRYNNCILINTHKDRVCCTLVKL